MSGTTLAEPADEGVPASTSGSRGSTMTTSGWVADWRGRGRVRLAGAADHADPAADGEQAGQALPDAIIRDRRRARGAGRRRGAGRGSAWPDGACARSRPGTDRCRSRLGRTTRRLRHPSRMDAESSSGTVGVVAGGPQPRQVLGAGTVDLDRGPLAGSARAREPGPDPVGAGPHAGQAEVAVRDGRRIEPACRRR